MTKHSLLSGADLHEPKGADTASAGTVYVADGSGSGTWSNIVGTNVVIVENEDDFPTSSAGVITLAEDTVYLINGTVDIGTRRLVAANNSTIRGYGGPLNSHLVSTTTGVLLTITDINFRVMDVSLSAANASALWDIDGTGAEKVTFIEVVVPVCDAIGDVDNLHEFYCNSITFESITTNGMTFTGAFSNLHLHEIAADSFAGTLINLGTATFNYIAINDATAVLGAGDTWLTIAASSANLNSGKQGFIYANNIDASAGGTVITGYTTSDTGWIVHANYGIAASLRQGQGYIENNATATTFTGTGSGNEVVTNFGTGFNSGVASGFTISNAGRFTYTGISSRSFLVHANIFASIAGGASRTYNWYIAKNGTIIASSVSQRSYDGTNAGSCSCTSVVSLSTNDYVELYIRAETATTSLTADTVSITVVEV